MKKFLSLSLVLVMIVSMLAMPAFAAKPENPGNSNKIEKLDKEKPNKPVKVEDEDEVEDADVEDEEVEDEELTSADKLDKLLLKWQKRFEKHQGEDEEDADVEAEDEDADVQDEDADVEIDEEALYRRAYGKGHAKDALPPGLLKKGEDLPPGLAKRDVLPYGLLKRIEDVTTPAATILDTITDEELHVETLLLDALKLLKKAEEGEEQGQYFSGSIEDFEDALDLYYDILDSDTATDEELAEALEDLNDAYNVFIMSRTATEDELEDYNDFLEDLEDILDDLKDVLTVNEYEEIEDYYDSLTPFDEDEDLVSIEALLELMADITEEFDKYMPEED